MEGPARTRLVALVVLLALAVPLVVVAASGGGGEEDEEAGLRVERSPQVPELIVYVEPDVNSPDRAAGRRTVTLECVGPGGSLVVAQDHPWPFTDTDQGTVDPHVHVTVNPERIGEVERCQARGTEPRLEGPVL
jgi:hypothetical protein